MFRDSANSPSAGPVFLLIGVGTAWGAVPAIARFAVTNGIGPVGYVFWVAITAAAICGGICLVRGVRPRFTRRHVRYYLLSGCTRFVVAGVVMYTVLQKVPAGMVAVILGTAPLLTFGASVVLRMEDLSVRRGVGVFLGFCGIALMFAPSVILSLGSAATVPTGWLALGFVTPLIYAYSNITIDRSRPAGEDSMAMTAGMFILAAGITLPVSLLAGEFHPIWATGIGVPEMAMFGHAAILSACFFGLYELIRRTDATFGGQATYVTTLSGIVYGMILLGERPGLTIWAAAILILAGVALVNSRSRTGRGKSGGR